MRAGRVPYACPRCKGTVKDLGSSFECSTCSQRYPVVSGIVDFRLEPDPWIGIEDDRAKALRVEEAGKGLDFEGMVRAYWRMTPGTPRELAERFVAHVLRAEERSREWLEQLGHDATPDSGPWLDEGCGTADLAAAMGARACVACLDVAMRWLVVARRRLQERGLDPWLVCANAEYLPFPDATFSRVFSVGLLEHCGDAEAVLRDVRRVLKPGEVLRLRTVNRYSLLLEPHLRIWGVGFLPRPWADRYVRWRTGDGYDKHRPLGPLALQRVMEQAGFEATQVSAASFLKAEAAGSFWLQRLGGGYDLARRIPPLGQLLKWFAPLLEARAIA